MSPSSVLVRVEVPDVVVPAVDLAEVRTLASTLDAGAERLAASAWRLGGASAAMAGALGWCGPASGAFLTSCAEQRSWFGNAWDALVSAGATCRRYADELEPATAEARQARARAHRLTAELVHLRDQIRQLDLRRAAAPTSGPTEIALFTSEGSTAAEASRLQAWADRLEADAHAVQAAVHRVEETVRRADERAAGALDQVASMTFAARRLRADRALAAARAMAGPREDGSPGSRIGGFLGALRDDVTGPLSLLGGLVGLDGDVADHWSALGSAAGHALSHPVDLGGALVDWTDLKHGDWGHWLGSIGPTAAGSLLTAGGYATVRSAEALELLAGADALAARVAALTELAEHAELAAVIAANGGFADSILVRGGGLAIHEAAGGHTLAKHVGLTEDQLRARLGQDRRWTTSTFPDRPTAERAVADVLDARSADIVQWLESNDVKVGDSMALELNLGRSVGQSVKPGKVAVEPVSVKVWLERDRSALGFHISSAYPVR